ncbi:MAG: enoyl-CoA hydratase-related protein [Candidatus Dormibacteraeota bacterium]|jgi:enoyl-CoA hydratase|nr:enoyl-CoA hydratase-related protein [Candidatus Dormibacteraeota bacterium]
MSAVVDLRREGPIGWLTIDHPPANSLNREVLDGLRRGLRELEEDGDVRAAVITGAGNRFFVAGADIGEFQTDGPDATAEKIALGQQLTLEMERSRLPLVAAVNGFALGGGLELAMACDLRVASRTARLGQPEILLGIIPGWGGTQRLPRLVGRGVALELLLSGDQIQAERALELGLVNSVVDHEDLLEAAQGMADKLAARAPLATAAIKRAVAQGLDRPLDQALAIELREFQETFRSEDAAEGIAAFMGKRQAEWTGR